MPELPIESAWCIASQRNSQVRELAEALRIPDYVARVLVNRGVADVEAGRRFLAPSASHLEDPFAFRQMDRAVARILQALERGERIVVQGDYDVDGSAASALLVNLFRLLGVEVTVSIPSRSGEGYGLNERIVRDAVAAGARLMITCDNGTTALQPIAVARELGLDVIVTDHHTVGETLPDAYAVLNPHVKDETLRFRDLCGAGVAFKLAWAVLQRISRAPRMDQPFRDFLASAQSLVALASVADVVPLSGDNRVLTRMGLRLMPDNPNPGIRALLESSGVEGAPGGTDIGFKLAPRINAGGRLGRETLGLELLTARSFGEAMELAREADALNRKRQALDRELTRLAEEMVQADAGYESERVLVLGHPEFHAGVVGIVAARLCRRFNKPTVLVAVGAETARGSGRSVAGFHLYNALNECSGLMQRFGGHAQAAGLELDPRRLPELRREINRVADKHVTQADYETPTLNIDAEVRLSALDPVGVRLLSELEPFGQGNPEPLFMAAGVEVASPPKVVGRGTGHLSLMLKQEGPALKAIAFGAGSRVGEVARGTRLRVAYTPRINSWRGIPEVEVEIKDFRPQ
ncbi:MAG: single-stranded-DNA-specific exonuclease RecJ [Planctomycetes bacterium]|nr:single-stranded-DNA-specific exonuclease RecJ [Planctomycetota bacterium]